MMVPDPYAVHMDDERFEVVDEEGRVVGTATRRACHSNPALIHQTVHVLVLDGEGRLFLQKRSAHKDIQPGKWDTSVGGHMVPGEAPEAAAAREMTEELGVPPRSLRFLYRYLWRSNVETELVRTFMTLHEGPFRLHPDEIEEGRFWGVADVEQGLGSGCFTPNFELEFRKLRSWQAQAGGTSAAGEQG